MEELGPVEAREAAPLLETLPRSLCSLIQVLARRSLYLFYAFPGRRVYDFQTAVLRHALGFLLPHKEAAPAEDEDHRGDEHHRRERVDDRADAELDHGVDLQGQRAGSHPRDEERYDEVVERERERQQSPGHDAG